MPEQTAAALPTVTAGAGWTHTNADALTLLRSLPDGSVNLICTDPPYFRVKGDDWDNQWKTPARFVAWLETVVLEYRRVLAPNGSLYLFAWPRMAADVEVMIARHFNVLSSIAWVKPDPSCQVHPGPGQIGRASKEALRVYFPRQERVIFAEHKTDPFADKERVLRQEAFSPLGLYFQTEREAAGLTRNEVEVALGFVSGDDPERGTALACRWEQGEGIPKPDTYERFRALLRARSGRPEIAPKGYDELRAMYRACRAAFELERAKYEHLRRPFHSGKEVLYSDTWFFMPAEPGEGKHPCEKPLDMLRHIVRVSSNPGDIVLDTFAGSASTGAASLLLGRRFIGCDKSAHWYGVGVETLRHAEEAAARPPELRPALTTVADIRAAALQPALF